MEFILQIQEIVEGPIKDLYLNFNSSLPGVELPEMTNNFGPQEVNDINFSSDWENQFSSQHHFSNEYQFSTEWGSDNFLNQMGSTDIFDLNLGG